MLTATETIENAFDRIKAHQKEMEGRDIQYMMSFWVGGEALCHAVIAESTSVDTCREKDRTVREIFLALMKKPLTSVGLFAILVLSKTMRNTL
ncbi:hypothetical protein ALHIDCOG_00267 [Klebsiella phage CPRSB]|nr:hypothetical protein ALHIDCOG_00267 [Klebsiella phage CPRSB]